MFALLRHAAVIDDENAVHVLHSAEAMSYGDRSATLLRFVERLLDDLKINVEVVSKPYILCLRNVRLEGCLPSPTLCPGPRWLHPKAGPWDS